MILNYAYFNLSTGEYFLQCQNKKTLSIIMFTFWSFSQQKNKNKKKRERGGIYVISHVDVQEQRKVVDLIDIDF